MDDLRTATMMDDCISAPQENPGRRPPKRKRSIFWWLGGAFLVLLFVFVFQLFGPSPRIIVSNQTTYITNPLRPDGLPDYEAYTLELSRHGATPENNAAALLWPALWPGELDPPNYVTVAAELGLNAIPARPDAVVPVYQRINSWVRSQRASTGAADSIAKRVDNDVDRIFTQVTSRPWTSKLFPWLAKWVTENQKPLDKLVEASHRTRCYFPSPSLLNSQNEMLYGVLYPGVQGVRETGRSLGARAMWHVGENRPNEAWHDLIAMHRIGQVVATGPTLLDQLVGMAISGVACDGTTTMLHESRLTPQQSRQVMRDLQSLEGFTRMADSIDHAERVSYLDCVIELSHGNFDMQLLKEIDVGQELSYLHHLNVDWNVVLRTGNQYFDRYASAAAMQDRAARRQAIAALEFEVAQSYRNWHGNSLVATLVSPAARSDMVAAASLARFLPAFRAALGAQDRANTTLDLARLAAAIAVFRAEHGAYPNKLDELISGIVERRPADNFRATPFRYRRIDDGYLLYSAGENGQDDGGSNEQTHIFEGRPLDELDNSDPKKALPQIPAGADDISIRVPRSPKALP